jgi:hypothetical protein
MLQRVPLVRADVSEKGIASIIRATRIGELRTIFRSVFRLLVTENVVPRSPILVTLMMEAIRSSGTLGLTRARGVTSHKTAFFIVTAEKTSNLT